MARDVETRPFPPGARRFFHRLALGVGAAALASAVLTFLEMRAANKDHPGA